MKTEPLNTIYYGPPGTGKTIAAMKKAVEIIDNIPDDTKADDDKYQERFQELCKEGRVKFCTFHQSYGYEDFVEGMRIDKDGRFTVKDGVFKEMCQSSSIYAASLSVKYNQNNFWVMPLGDLNDKETYQRCLDHSIVAIGVENDNFAKNMKLNDIVFIREGVGGKNRIKAIAKITGHYYKADDSTEIIRFLYRRAVEWLYKIDDGQVVWRNIGYNPTSPPPPCRLC